VARAEREYGMSERHASRLLGQWRGTQRYDPDADGGMGGWQGPGAADLAAGSAAETKA
jgi:hypothetical protein